MNIYVNQLGYMTKGRKRAVLALDAQALSADRNMTVFIFEHDRERCVFRKNAVFAGIDEASKDAVWQVDFSEFQKKGRYRLAGSGGCFSASFEIGDGLYGNLLIPLAKTYYFQRCGMELEEKYAGIFKRKCCHQKKALLLEDYQKMQNGMSTEQVRRYEVTGGWHDAGDYGRYTTPAAVAVAHLLYAWQWFPESFQRSLGIPESGSGMDDILCECQYELRWLLKMQREDGGVFHKLTSMRHANFVMPGEDRRQMILFPVSSYATGAFAAVTALAARIYQPYDSVFSEQMLKASQRAWQWLTENEQTVDFHNPKACNTGEYGDDCDTDERLWAAAELYRSTKDISFLEKAVLLKQQCHDETGIGWRNVAGLAGFAFLEDEIRNKKMIADADDSGAENGLKQQYYI
ncbi:MAG: glycoside hydrolase family 9 protein, partial [Lachnospiraceae bacterium]|nr:glycoside hydrolase family 9 protein [Lachnospiraceae bacterium]